MKLIDEKNGESWFKMPHALIDHTYPLLTGDAVKTHLVVTRWTHGLKNQRTTTSMTLGQVDEKCGFGNWKAKHAKASQELKQLEANGLIKVTREKGKTNKIRILRPDYKTLKERVERLSEESKVPLDLVPTSENEVPPNLVPTVPPNLVPTLGQSTHKFSPPSIDIDNIDTSSGENERDIERVTLVENTEIIMEVFESHMVHANKYRKAKSGIKRSADIRAFWDMFVIDRIEFNDIMEAIKYVYEGEGGWWSPKLTNAATFRKNFATIHGQVQQTKQKQTGIVGLA